MCMLWCYTKRNRLSCCHCRLYASVIGYIKHSKKQHSKGGVALRMQSSIYHLWPNMCSLTFDCFLFDVFFIFRNSNSRTQKICGLCKDFWAPWIHSSNSHRGMHRRSYVCGIHCTNNLAIETTPTKAPSWRERFARTRDPIMQFYELHTCY